tara:strand:- start:22 stop:942 length:921 start_codon:yes stop_codon:yes gene_type:complete
MERGYGGLKKRHYFYRKKYLEISGHFIEMLKNANKNEQKRAQKFLCSKCEYITTRKNNWSRHLASTKHKMLTNANKNEQKRARIFACECGKEYSHYSSLSRHKKGCVGEEEKGEYLENIYNELVKMNDKTSVKNQTINNNQKISINVFLNEYCTNAMNLKDFVHQLNVTLEDLDMTQKLGYVDGISNIFIKNLKELPTIQRPIHCSDSKRGQFFIKDEDKWGKENGEKLEKVIDMMQIMQIKTLKNWEKKNPNYLKDEYLLMRWNEMVHNIMGSDQNEERNKNKKIILKNVGEEIPIKEAMKNIDK